MVEWPARPFPPLLLRLFLSLSPAPRVPKEGHGCTQGCANDA